MSIGRVEFLRKVKEIIKNNPPDLTDKVGGMQNDLWFLRPEVGGIQTPHYYAVVRGLNRGKERWSLLHLSPNYKFITHSQAAEWVESRLLLEGVTYSLKTSSDAFVRARLLFKTEETIKSPLVPETDPVRVGFIIDNTYQPGESLKLSLALVGAGYLLPCTLLARRVHIENTLSQLDWERVLDLTGVIPKVLKEMGEVHTNLSLWERRLSQIKTVYRRYDKDGRPTVVEIPVGEQIFALLRERLEDETPTVLDLWWELSEISYQSELKGLTLVAKRKLEVLLREVFTTFLSRVEKGVEVKVLNPPALKVKVAGD